MFCTKCGKQIDDDSNFCVFCGDVQVHLQQNYTNGKLEPFCFKDKWGFKDTETRDIIVSPIYSSARCFSNNRAVVEINCKYSVIDQYGKELVPFKYDYIVDFKNGFAKVKRDDRWTFLNLDCKEISAFKYTSIEDFQDYVSIAECNGRFTLINKVGKEITQELLESISFFKNRLYIVKNHSTYGIINDQGDCIHPTIYNSVKIINKNLLLIEKDSSYGIINELGKIVLNCEYNSIIDINKSFLLISQKNKYGLFRNDSIILNCKYSNIEILDDASIIGKENGKWKLFDSNGKENPKETSQFKKFVRKKNYTKRLTFAITILSIFFIFLTYDYFTDSIGLTKFISNTFNSKEQKDWNKAQSDYRFEGPNTIHNYIKKYPSGKYHKQAELFLDSTAWVTVTTNKNQISINEYLKKYPNGKYSDKARDELLWIQTSKLNTAESYKNYKQKFPNGEHIAEATNKSEYLEWMEIQNNPSRELIARYLYKYPESVYAALAKDYFAWVVASEQSTLKSYHQYLSNFPNGNFSDNVVEIFKARGIFYSIHNISFRNYYNNLTGSAFLNSELTYVSPTFDLISIENATLEIAYKRQNPDGSFEMFPATTNTKEDMYVYAKYFKVKKGINIINLGEGIGHKSPNNWEPGRYYFHIFIDRTEFAAQEMIVK